MTVVLCGCWPDHAFGIPGLGMEGLPRELLDAADHAQSHA